MYDCDNSIRRLRLAEGSAGWGVSQWRSESRRFISCAAHTYARGHPPSTVRRGLVQQVPKLILAVWLFLIVQAMPHNARIGRHTVLKTNISFRKGLFSNHNKGYRIWDLNLEWGIHRSFLAHAAIHMLSENTACAKKNCVVCFDSEHFCGCTLSHTRLHPSKDPSTGGAILAGGAILPSLNR